MTFQLSKIAKAIIPLCSVLALSGCIDDHNDLADTSQPSLERPSIDVVIPEVNGATATVPQAGTVTEPVTAANQAVIYMAAKNSGLRSANFDDYSLHIWNNDSFTALAFMMMWLPMHVD